MSWSRSEPGVLELPTGLLVRGRRLGLDLGAADHTLVLGRGPVPLWSYRQVRWPDFWVPLDGVDALDALQEAYARVREGQRVEVSCRGGVGRTGTALAALTVLDGSTPGAAVAWVRTRYHRRAVEAPWQRRWLRQVGRSSAETRPSE